MAHKITKYPTQTAYSVQSCVECHVIACYLLFTHSLSVCVRACVRACVCVCVSALYLEPRFNIHLKSTSVKVQFETEGFPKPEVIWLGEHDQNLSSHLEIHGQKEDGLYFIKSSYEVQKPAVNVTFTLKNHLLNQNLQRPVFLSYGKDLLSLSSCQKAFTME